MTPNAHGVAFTETLVQRALWGAAVAEHVPVRCIVRPRVRPLPSIRDQVAANEWKRYERYLSAILDSMEVFP